MCKASGYVKELKELMDKIDRDHSEYSNKVKVNDYETQDILHMIENTNFSASDGFKLCKHLKDVRIDRRHNKRELDTLHQLKSTFVDANRNRLQDAYNKVEAKDSMLKKLQDDKTYKPRVENGEIVHTPAYKGYWNKSKGKSSDRIKAGENRYGVMFVPNAKYNNQKSSLNGADAMVLGKPQSGYYECLMVNHDGGLLKSTVKKQYISIN